MDPTLPRYGTDFIAMIPRYGTDFIAMIPRYGNDSITTLPRYGNDSITTPPRYGTDSITMIPRYGNDFTQALAAVFRSLLTIVNESRNSRWIDRWELRDALRGNGPSKLALAW